MNERIRALILEGLSGAKECPAKSDIVEELTENLTEKYNDLIAGGAPEEEAFRIVAENIGDLGEVRDFINSSPNTAEPAGEDPFAALGGIFKRMAQELKAPFKEMGGTVRSNLTGDGMDAERFQRMAQELKSPLQEVGASLKKAAIAAGKPMKDIGAGLADTAREVRDNLREQYGESRSRREACSYDFAAEAEDVNVIFVSTVDGDVEFYPSDDGKVHVLEYTDGDVTEDKLAAITLTNGELKVEQGKRNASGWVFFRNGVLESRFEIFLPDKVWQTLRIKTVNGDVEGYAPIRADKLLVGTVSGDVDFKCVEVNSAELSTMSGDVGLDGVAGELRATTVSGDMELHGYIERSFLKTTSGDLTLTTTEVPTVMEAESVSGDLTFGLKDNAGFTLKYKTVSGDIRSDFPLLTALSRRDGTAVYGDGSLHTYSARTVSGDLRIRRVK